MKLKCQIDLTYLKTEFIFRKNFQLRITKRLTSGVNGIFMPLKNERSIAWRLILLIWQSMSIFRKLVQMRFKHIEFSTEKFSKFRNFWSSEKNHRFINSKELIRKKKAILQSGFSHCFWNWLFVSTITTFGFVKFITF